MSTLIHEIQKERGATTGFISSQGNKFVDTLTLQKSFTNSKYSELINEFQAFNLEKLPPKLVAQLQLALHY